MVVDLVDWSGATLGLHIIEMRKASLKMDCMPNFDAKESRGKGARFGGGKRHKGCAGGMPVTSIRFQCAWRPLLDRGPNEPTNKARQKSHPAGAACLATQVAADHRLEVVWVIELLLNGRSPCQLFHGVREMRCFRPTSAVLCAVGVGALEAQRASLFIAGPGVLTREDRAQQKLDVLAIARPGLLVPVRAQPWIH